MNHLPENPRHTVAEPQTDDGSSHAPGEAVDAAIQSDIATYKAAGYVETPGMVNVGVAIDWILKQLMEATQILVELHPITDEEQTKVAKLNCCVSLALGGVNLLVPKLPE